MPLDDLRTVDGFLYLGTPYSLYPYGLDAAAEEAARIAGELLKRGIKVHSPIAESHAIAKAAGIDPIDHAFWMARCRPIMRAAGGFIGAMMESWSKSVGLTEEISYFVHKPKPSWMLDPDTLEVQRIA